MGHAPTVSTSVMTGKPNLGAVGRKCVDKIWQCVRYGSVCVVKIWQCVCVRYGSVCVCVWIRYGSVCVRYGSVCRTSQPFASIGGLFCSRGGKPATV